MKEEAAPAEILPWTDLATKEGTVSRAYELVKGLWKCLGAEFTKTFRIQAVLTKQRASRNEGTNPKKAE